MADVILALIVLSIGVKAILQMKLDPGFTCRAKTKPESEDRTFLPSPYSGISAVLQQVGSAF
jgi:hypothetical protein